MVTIAYAEVTSAESIKSKLSETFPRSQITVKETRLNGVFEVLVDGKVFYTDGNSVGSYEKFVSEKLAQQQPCCDKDKKKGN